MRKGRKFEPVKALVFGIAALLIALPLTSSINAIPMEQTIEVHVLQYCEDGSVREVVKELSMKEARKLRGKIDSINNSPIELNLEERLRVLKEYNLVSKDVTAEQLKSGMEERAKTLKKIGITRESLSEKLPMIVDLLKGSSKGDEIASFIDGGIESAGRISSLGLFSLRPIAFSALGITLGVGEGFYCAVGTHSTQPSMGADALQYFFGKFGLELAGFPNYLGIGLIGCVIGFVGVLVWTELPSSTLYIQILGCHLYSIWLGAFIGFY
jgi:hypothetical protein